MLPVRPEPFDQRYLSFTPPQPGPTPPERHEPAPARAGNGWTVVAALQWSPRLKAHLPLLTLRPPHTSPSSHLALPRLARRHIAQELAHTA